MPNKKTEYYFYIKVSKYRTYEKSHDLNFQFSSLIRRSHRHLSTQFTIAFLPVRSHEMWRDGSVQLFGALYFFLFWKALCSSDFFPILVGIENIIHYVYCFIVHMCGIVGKLHSLYRFNCVCAWYIPVRSRFLCSMKCRRIVSVQLFDVRCWFFEEFFFI